MKETLLVVSVGLCLAAIMGVLSFQIGRTWGPWGVAFVIPIAVGLGLGIGGVLVDMLKRRDGE